jgi:hypothetical protein
MVKSVEYERMWQLLDSDLEVLVQSGFIYLPLLFDPAIEGEIQTSTTPKTLMKVDGRHFIKTLRLQSLAETYERIDPEVYQQVRRMCLQKYSGMVELSDISIPEKLRMILFHVMPHFIRRKKSLDRRKLSQDEILGLIAEKVTIPRKYDDKAAKFLHDRSLRLLLGELEKGVTRIHPPEGGLTTGRKIREWLMKALEVRILNGEKERLRQLLYHREEFGETQRKSVAVLLYIAGQGGVEIDGFGFSRIGSSDDYLIHKQTGEYALKDFYGRLYLFPDCRVAVSTGMSSRPFIIERYKHPFLEGFDPGQQICVRDFILPNVFTGASVIKALEEGINALLYGYSSRRRNGYHSLDRATRHMRGTDVNEEAMSEFEEGPLGHRRRVPAVHFDDCRVPRDHPKITSGDVAVTNDYTL